MKMADNKSKAQNELEPLEEVVDTANIQNKE